MIEAFLSVLIALLFLAIIVYVVMQIVNMIAFPAPAKTIVYIIIGILVLLALLRILGYGDLNFAKLL